MTERLSWLWPRFRDDYTWVRTLTLGGAGGAAVQLTLDRFGIAEFAVKGYYGASAEAIARRVGVTQLYLFRLFPGKKAIFVAALTRSMEDTRLAFEEAVDEVEGGGRALHGMASARTRLIPAHPSDKRLIFAPTKSP